MKYFRRFAYLTVIAILVLVMGMYKPPLKNVTTGELDAIYGIRQGGVIMYEIQNYILEHPNAKVEDLRSIKGVDDMIIEQLERRFR